MAFVDPLPMSQKKEDLIRHLNMHPDTYIMMANETDHVYKWLTSDKHHLKNNCQRRPPYDWSDIVENSKDEAMRRIAGSGDAHTSYYWRLSGPETKECPNWIARWFLYHKFRYRDGRSRNSVKGGRPLNPKESMADDQHPQGYGSPATASTSMSNAYQATGYSDYKPSTLYDPNTAASHPQEQYNVAAKTNGYWDPVRDSAQGR